MIPFITQILKIEPFKVLCLWNTDEIRLLDFELQFEKWRKENDETVLQLSDYEVFKYVSISEAGTLQWVNVQVKLFFKGRERTEPLELDSVVLYEQSRSVKDYKLVEILEAA
jgi:hypothetical protein